jgi:3-oxoacyl-[acyl-carrier-protein] synthase-3
VKKRKIEEHELEKGDVVLFASVGAGMNINAVAYREAGPVRRDTKQG